MISITFEPMNKQSAFDYKILSSYLLPKSILEFFDVTAVNEGQLVKNRKNYRKNRIIFNLAWPRARRSIE